MNVDLGQKFVSKSLDDVIELSWQKSFKSKSVLFDCSRLEWISNSEIAFLFSWIRALEHRGILVSIQLQSSYGLPPKGETYFKRKYCLERLLVQWQLRTHISPNTTVIFGGIQADTRSAPSISNYSPIPIQQFKAHSFDQDFENIFNRYLKRFSDNLRNAIQKTDITYYDSQFLDYSVFKELYSNVCLHAASNRVDECFFTVGLNRKFTGNATYLSESRLSELSDSERTFFSENGSYRNIDFIEISFHDFGVGIAKSLEKNYTEETEEALNDFFGVHYEMHKRQTIDTRVIEYALLLFTSRFEIERKLDIHDYIPRGLYIIKELVKQYHGYFEVSSYEGSVGLSFKGGKTHLSYKQNKSNAQGFPGTRIKIIFPALHIDYNVEQESASFSNPDIGELAPIKHIHFLKDFCEVENQLLNESVANPGIVHQQIVAKFFSRILEYFRRTPQNSIIMIDFAGAEPSTIDFYNKFIYFITHFPLYGDRRLLFYNTYVKGLNRTVIIKRKDSLNTKGIIASTIPCIHIDHTVEWLGIENPSDAEHFTEVWKESARETYSFNNLSRYNSTLIAVKKVSKQYRVELRLPPFSQILDEIDEAITRCIRAEVDNTGIQYNALTSPEKTNFNHISISKANTCYLSARGKIVLTYISFTEKLYIISYRRMISAYFIFKLYRTLKDDGLLTKINKILSVTLSSQMIGHEVSLMLHELHNSQVRLVALSNYYNFQNEEKFSEIAAKNRVLIVIDVISTGNLINNMIKSIELAEAHPICCLAIANLNANSINATNVPVISLTTQVVEHLDEVPEGFEIEVINPVMNVPTSMPKAKSKENVLMSKKHFFSLVDEKYLLVGNFKNNSVYFNYFLNTYELLSNDKAKGYPLVKQLLSLLREKKQGVTNAEIVNLIKGLDIISKSITHSKSLKRFVKVKKELSKIIEDDSPGLFDEYKVDIVFFPFLSNISVVEQDISLFVESKLNSSSPGIFPIPRIMTTKGWRFSFPPKFLNYLLNSNNLSVLILDDGSLSGETIMQMIDSISFLSVKSIDVLSIFGRVEDFQKELFSRIKSVQVKGSVVPITVYFGSHANIPVHNQFDSPFQMEYREIVALENKLINRYKIELSDQFETYLESRKKYLLGALHPSMPGVDFLLFPSVSRIKLFTFRDFIGRFGSYRLYVDDHIDDLPLKDIDRLIASKEDLLTMLTVLNLEPELYHTFKRMFRKETINEKIQIIIEEFLTSQELMAEEWMKEFFIKSLFNLSSNRFFACQNLMHLVQKLHLFSTASYQESFRYLEYIILLAALGIKNPDKAFEAKSFEVNMQEFISELKLNNEEIYHELRLGFAVFQQIQSSKNLDSRFYINKYHYLRNYFTQAKIYEDKHDDKLLPNIFGGLLKAVSELKFSIENKIDSDIAENTEKLYKELDKLQNKYRQNLNFRFIDEIINNLYHFASTDLPFEITSAITAIRNLNDILEEPKPVVDTHILGHILKTLDLYKDLLLRSNSAFASYVLNANGFLMDEWRRTETAFCKMRPSENIVMVDHSMAENVAVNVHPYALNLAFENILKNKHQYAQHTIWKMSTVIIDNHTELIIEQDSAFVKAGDGTGQSAIRSILREYGVQYRMINENPYTLKITFPNKFSDEERA
jgi:hypothetical protein